MAKRLGQAMLIFALAMTGGCSTLGYYTQAVMGQMAILTHRRPIDRVLADPATDDAIRHKLGVSRDVCSFAREELGLPVGDTYSDYVDVGRPYVVWNVFAAPEFSLSLESFCYPIAGCVTYRGFFSEKDARAFAEKMAAKGNDVFVGGVAAYSTLGWFDDPVLNTFLTRSDEKLAALLFHELAHKAVYVPGDTAFNESFATAVERAALRRWFAARAEPEAFAEYLARDAREQQVVRLIKATNERLAVLYEQDLPADVMRAQKRAAIDDLRARYAALRESWGDHDEFKYWMETDINNAKLGTVATYNDWVDSFMALLAQQDGSLPAFIDKVRELGELGKDERDRRLASLATSHTRE
jgi:predicted aminopeptidase